MTSERADSRRSSACEQMLGEMQELHRLQTEQQKQAELQDAEEQMTGVCPPSKVCFKGYHNLCKVCFKGYHNLELQDA